MSGVPTTQSISFLWLQAQQEFKFGVGEFQFALPEQSFKQQLAGAAVAGKQLEGSAGGRCGAGPLALFAQGQRQALVRTLCPGVDLDCPPPKVDGQVVVFKLLGP